VGLSGGSHLALRMADKYPDIKGVVAMTPYIGPDERVRVVNNVLNTVAEHSFVKLPQWLDFIPYNKNIRTIPNNPIPHTQGTLANAQAMFSIGTQVDKVKVPVQFFTTAGDLLSGTDPVRRLYERSGGDSKNGWEHFEAEAKVPHAMASPKQFEGAGQIWDQVFETIEQGVQPKRKP
jgi:esterase/lipase